MKKLVFLFLGFFCFANSQIDSARIVQKLEKLDKVTTETKVLLKKADVIAKENQTLIFRIKSYIDKLTNRVKDSEKKAEILQEIQAIKPNNINEPVTEIQFPVADGYDSIRGSFFYRLFHRDIYILKPYKIINNEKIYLD